MARIPDIAGEIARSLQTYTTDVTEAMEKEKAKVAREAVKKLKSRSPVRTGAYAKGWRTRKVGTAQVIYNATRYQLAHLLEKGHAKRNGGRVAPRVHIRPVEEEAISEYTKRVEAVIRG